MKDVSINGEGYKEQIPVRRDSERAVVGDYYVVRIGNTLSLSYVLSPAVKGTERQLVDFDLQVSGNDDVFDAIRAANRIINGLIAQ